MRIIQVLPPTSTWLTSKDWIKTLIIPHHSAPNCIWICSSFLTLMDSNSNPKSPKPQILSAYRNIGNHEWWRFTVFYFHLSQQRQSNELPLIIWKQTFSTIQVSSLSVTKTWKPKFQIFRHNPRGGWIILTHLNLFPSSPTNFLSYSRKTIKTLWTIYTIAKAAFDRRALGI